MSYISILNHSSSSVCQNGQRRMCKESFKEGLSTILTFSRVWMRVWESSRGTAWVFARVDLYSVFVKFCEWLRGYGKHTIKHAVPDSDARAAIICIKTCVLSVCEGVGRYIQCDCVHVCASTCACVFPHLSITFLTQSSYSTFIPLVGLYPVLLCLWI